MRDEEEKSNSSLEELDSDESIETIDFDEKQHASISGYCYLKTKAERLKCYWCTVIGKEIFFYKDKKATEYKLMHSLVGTFVKDGSGKGEDTKPD